MFEVRAPSRSRLRSWPRNETEEDLEAIENALERRTAAVSNLDVDEFIAADIAFHQAVVLASHNGCSPAVRGVRAQTLCGPQTTVRSIARGRALRRGPPSIVAAIRAQDAEQAAHAALQYLSEADPSDPSDDPTRKKVVRLRSEVTGTEPHPRNDSRCREVDRAVPGTLARRDPDWSDVDTPRGHNQSARWQLLP
ncbi:FCD domain-containing protein [Rhodococcus hoagii]|nr:FCD domain-containing protein [Prescottella equi]